MTVQADLQFTTAQTTTTESRAFDGFAIEHVRFYDNAPFEYAREGETFYLSVHDVRLEAGEARISDGQRSERLDLCDTLTFLPPSARIEGWSKPRARAQSFTTLNFLPAMLAPDLGDLYQEASLQPLLYGRNQEIARTLGKMANLICEGHEGSMPLEQLAIVAACEVHTMLRPGQAVAHPKGLSSAQLNRAVEYIAAHMTDDISLDDLARAADLSRFHFSRAFGASMGMSPYAYLTTQRAEAATSLLGSTTLPLEEVALRSGFGTTAKLRRAMERLHGVSPLTYRRNHQ